MWQYFLLNVYTYNRMSSNGARQEQKINLLFKKYNNVVDVIDYLPYTDPVNRYPYQSYTIGDNVFSDSIPADLQAVTYIDGSILGKHNGIIDYTIGQRRGLGIGGVSGLDETRLYVVDINVAKNQVVVGPKEALNVDEIYLKEMNWISNTGLSEENIFVKVRNTGNLIKAKLKLINDQVILLPEEHTEGISPGQAAVIYNIKNSNHVLGGGWIEETKSNFTANYKNSFSAT